MSEETKVIERPNSCKIAINAKGQHSGEIKVYAETSEKALTDALDKSIVLRNVLNDRNKGL